MDRERKLRQRLLILCCLAAVSGVHYENGDSRWLEDVLQREEEAWSPRVGTEDYWDLQDARTEQSSAWHGCALAFASTFPGLRPKYPELRSQLRHVLQEISLLTDWPHQKMSRGIRQYTCESLDWKMSLWLVLFSCAVMPITWPSSSKIWETQGHDLQQLASFLTTSSLFENLATFRLKDWIQKLESLFCGPGADPAEPVPIYVVAFWVCEQSDDTFIAHFRKLRVRSTLCRDTSSEPTKYQYRCIFEKNESCSSLIDNDLVIGKRLPKYHEAVLCAESALRHWREIVRMSAVLLDHRCPKPVAGDGGELGPDDPETLKEVELIKPYIA